jgi:hypothetical protein
VGNGLEGGVHGGSERNGRREGKLSTRKSLSSCGTHLNISRSQKVSTVSKIAKFDIIYWENFQTISRK